MTERKYYKRKHYNPKQRGIAADGAMFLDVGPVTRLLMRTLLDRYNPKNGECRPTEEELKLFLQVKQTRTVRWHKKALKSIDAISYRQRKRRSKEALLS